jgi:hypothetical protein
MFRTNKNKTIWRIGFAVLLLGLAMAAISCARNSGNEPAFHKAKPVPPDQIATVGMDVCTNCHAGQVAQWITGQHSNTNPLGDLDSEGLPTYAMLQASCLLCHDQLGDGHRLVAMLTGNMPRPVIGCESCHGGGAEHYGVGPIPYPKPNHERCGQCHNGSLPAEHLFNEPNAGNIVEDYESSKHFNSINEHTLVSTTTAAKSTVLVQAVCSRCHTADGFDLYKDTVLSTMSYQLINDLLDNQSPLGNPDPVECRTCHDPHMTNADNLPRMPSSVVAGKTQSREFNTCTACHQLNKANGEVMGEGFHDPKVNSNGSTDDILYFNHAAVPGDTRGNLEPLGSDRQFLYYVNKGDDNACAACHNPHSADITINKQYAESGHGDALAKPWAEEKFGSSCQRCHTATGFKNYANNLTAGTVYNSANNMLAPELLFYLSSTQSMTIYCWGCHTDYKGGLRNPGKPYPITTTIESTYKTMAGAAITFPDVSGSNVCVLCHSGRKSGGSIAVSTGTFSNLSLISSHHAPSAGVLFKVIGYEYPSLDYSNIAEFKHDQIGLAGAPEGTGTYGPCVGCHMLNNTAEGVGPNQVAHYFMPVTTDGETITGIATTTCAACHTGANEMTADKLMEERDGFRAAQDALIYFLSTRTSAGGGQYWWGGDYGCAGFYKTQTDAQNCVSANAQKNWLSVGDAVTNGSVTGKKNMGAAFNLYLFSQDGGAFAHNRIYTRRLIYDSIDWIKDNNLNDSTCADLNALNATTYPFKDEAIAYLCGTGTRP